MKKAKFNIGVLILAAGNSTRMGSPKFLLKFDEERCFLQKIIDDYKAFGCREIKVVLNKTGKRLTEKENLQIVVNEDIAINPHEVSERFYSIKLGLGLLKEVSWVFIHHVDNPFADFNVLKSLTEFKEEADYFVPNFRGKGGHPILIGKSIKEAIKQTKENNLNFKKLLNKYSRKDVSVNTKNVLINVNTPNEYNDLFVI